MLPCVYRRDRSPCSPHGCDVSDIIMVERCKITRHEVYCPSPTLEVFAFLGVLFRSFPDSSGWLMELCQYKGLRTLKDVCDHLRFHHPPELLTMYLCIFGEKSILEADLSMLKTNSALLKRARVEGFRASGVVAVPAVLIKSCLFPGH